MRRLVECLVLSLAAWVGTAIADEGGSSFWLPGQFGSLAAVPVDQGWSLGAVYYHASQDAGGSKNFEIGGKFVVGLGAQADLVFIAPSYAFVEPILGAQAALGITGAVGRVQASVSATLTGPGGGTVSGHSSDSVTGGSDLYPQASLRWQDGNDNYLAYTMLGVPTGAYQAGRLANIGLNHWSLDAGGGYTYLDETTGREFSAVAGLTYNFENSATDYRSGIDSHLDWGASQFLSENAQVGLVGYVYYQLTGDSGSGDHLGEFKSRVVAVGPQVSWMFPLRERTKGYLNLKGYSEFDARNRPSGWNAWLSFSVPLSAKE